MRSLVRSAVVAVVVCGIVTAGAGVASAAESAPCAGCGPTSHVVQPGEWLWKIARNDLAQRGINAGDLSFVRDRANAIYARNRALIGSNPNRIRPGMRLVLPPL